MPKCNPQLSPLPTLKKHTMTAGTTLVIGDEEYLQYTQRSTSKVKENITNTPTDSALMPKIHISLQVKVSKLNAQQVNVSKLKLMLNKLR